MRILNLIGLFVLLAFTPLHWAWGADNPVIGQIKIATGAVHIVRDGKTLAVTEGQEIHLNDEAVTGGDGTLGITLEDSTTLSLGPDSQLILDAFVYDPVGEDLGLGLNLLQGTLAYVSGTIAHLAPDKVSVHTPIATIGIRGTRFVVKATPQ
ncbi:hypothetical protein JCM17960_23730 [Magnetospira thiophila]